MNRRIILIGAGVLLVVTVILLIKIRSSDTSADNRTVTDPVATTDTTPTGTSRRHAAKGDGSGDTDPDASKGSDDYVETIVNGVRVRDHRKNKRPVTQLPNVERPHQQPLPTELVGQVNQKLAAVMKACTAGQIPKDARGTKPKLEGTVFVDVKSGTLTVTESTVQIRDVTSDTAVIKQCFEQKVVGQNVPAGVTEDTTHYSIQLSYRIPE